MKKFYKFYVMAITTTVFILAITSFVSLAQPTTITSVGTPWENPLSWDLGRVPESNDDVVIANGILMQINADATVKSLTINSGSNRLTLAAGVELTVTDVLTNNSGMTYGLEMQSNSNQTASIIFGSAAGTGQLYYGRYMSGSNSTIKWHVISSPTTNALIYNVLDFYGQSGQNDLVVNGSNYYAFANYNENTNLWTYYSTDTDTWSGSMSSGKGFAMAITSYKTVNISGRIATGTVSRTIYKSSTGTKPPGGWGWNAIGNPYTAALNSIEFYNTNENKLDPVYGGLYLWNAETQSYNTITKARSGYIQVGQGFVVRAANDGSQNIGFSFGMRTHSSGTSFKSATITANSSTYTEDANYAAIDLYMNTDQLTRSASFVFNEGHTMGLDPYMDAGLLSAGNMDIYSFIEGEDVKFSDQALPKEKMDDMIIPLGIEMKKAAKADIKAEFTNFPADVSVVLEDKMMNTMTDLKKDIFNISMADNSSYTDRFFLHLTKSATGLPVRSQNDVQIYSAHKQINISGTSSCNAVLHLFNMMGSEIARYPLQDNDSHLIDASALPEGIYVVRLVKQNQVTSVRKLMLNE